MNQTTQAPNQLMGCDIVGPDGNKIGSVDGVWVDKNTSSLKFIGMKTGGIGGVGGETHVIPTEQAQIDSGNGQISVPFTKDQISNAPTCDPSNALTQDQENQIDSYYQQFGTSSGQIGGMSGQTQDPTIARTTVPGSGSTPMSGMAGTGSRTATEPGNFPVDNVTYNLMRLATERLRGLEQYDAYLQDAEGDQTISNFLKQLRQQDFQAAQQIQQLLALRLNSFS